MSGTHPRRGGPCVVRSLAVGLSLLVLAPGVAGAEAGGEEVGPRGVDPPGPEQPEAPRVLEEAEPEARPARGPARELVVYVPPRGRGSARVTAAGGTRAGASSGARVDVLAPRDHVGLTTRPQPTLYWILSGAAADRIDLTLVDDGAIDPLLELTLAGPVEPGVHVLSLRDHGLSLRAGRPYRFYVSLVMDAEHRSSDEIAGRVIERAPLTPELARGLGGTSASYGSYAREGIWYDALHDLNVAIEQEPDDESLRRQRHAWLEQAGLVAGADGPPRGRH